MNESCLIFNVAAHMYGQIYIIFVSQPLHKGNFFLLLQKRTVKKPDKISPEQKEFMVKLGKKLKKLRLDRNKGYKPLAEEMGVARNTYYAIEEGRLDFQFSSLYQILLYYKLHHNITLEEIFKDL